MLVWRMAVWLPSSPCSCKGRSRETVVAPRGGGQGTEEGVGVGGSGSRLHSAAPVPQPGATLLPLPAHPEQSPTTGCTSTV